MFLPSVPPAGRPVSIKKGNYSQKVVKAPAAAANDDRLFHAPVEELHKPELRIGVVLLLLVPPHLFLTKPVENRQVR